MSGLTIAPAPPGGVGCDPAAAGASSTGRIADDGLLDLDKTEADQLPPPSEPPLSFTAFVVASVARAAAAHPEVHAYRNWRGQVVSRRHIDVNTIVEIETAQARSRWLT